MFGSGSHRPRSVVLLNTHNLFEWPENMPGDEKLRNDHEESDEEEEEELEVVPQIDIEVTKLSALSPEVISKQGVQIVFQSALSISRCLYATINLGAYATTTSENIYLRRVARTTCMSRTGNRPS